ncbi:MAG: hypothetical protein WDA16_10635 [Candidatus Thermoplasmatota archaeon]
MKLVAWVLLALGFLTITNTTIAAYDPGSNLEADSPIILAGRTDALIGHSVASFVSPDKGQDVFLSLWASELSVTYRTIKTTCEASSSATQPLGSGTCNTDQGTTDTHTLTNAQLTLTRALTAYKVIVTNGDQYRSTPSFGAPGSLVASSGANTLLGAATKPLHLCPTDADWTDERKSCPIVPYSVDALDADVTSSGGSLRALGGYQVMLQGLEVKVTGTDKVTGKDFTSTYRTAGTETSVEYLLAEATNGDLSATSSAPLSGYGVQTVDARGSAAMQGATGHVSTDGSGADYSKEDAVLTGPVSFAITRVSSSDSNKAPRIAFAVSSDLRVADLATKPPKEDPTTQLVAAGAAGAGAAALIAGVVYFWPRLKFVGTLFLIPLYTRIERTAVLEHEKRDEIYELIRSAPGIHAHEIGEKTHIGWGTTVYHLKLLENHSLVVSKKSGRYKRFFVNTGEYTKKKDIYGALRNDTAKAVADFIVNHPGCNQKEMCAALSIQPSLASWHVEKLESVELVKRVKDGRMVRYFAGPAWSELNVRIHPGGGADAPAET